MYTYTVLCKRMGTPTLSYIFQIQYCHALLNNVRILKGNTVSLMNTFFENLEVISVLERNFKDKQALYIST